MVTQTVLTQQAHIYLAKDIFSENSNCRSPMQPPNTQLNNPEKQE